MKILRVRKGAYPEGHANENYWIIFSRKVTNKDHPKGCFMNGLERNKTGTREIQVRKHCTSQIRGQKALMKIAAGRKQGLERAGGI